MALLTTFRRVGILSLSVGIITVGCEKVNDSKPRAELLQSDTSKMSIKQNPYLSLRHQALTVTRQELGLPESGKPLAAIVDIGFSSDTVTVVAMADGTTSMYLSSGGGFIGGGDHPAIRKAGEALLKEATDLQSSMTETKEFPLPKDGMARFYLRTDKGLLVSSAQVGTHADTPPPLFLAAQEVITQFRLRDEGNR